MVMRVLFGLFEFFFFILFLFLFFLLFFCFGIDYRLVDVVRVFYTDIPHFADWDGVRAWMYELKLCSFLGRLPATSMQRVLPSDANTTARPPGYPLVSSAPETQINPRHPHL
jgi:hypothetical protein